MDNEALKHLCLQQSSHLALIDTLMMAYTVEMVSVERVMSCINRFAAAEPLHADRHPQELPYDTEDAVVTWINKVRRHAATVHVLESFATADARPFALRRMCETAALLPSEPQSSPDGSIANVIARELTGSTFNLAGESSEG